MGKLKQSLIQFRNYLQHPVRQIHQLPLVLSNLGYSCCLVLLQLTDVIGNYLRVQKEGK